MCTERTAGKFDWNWCLQLSRRNGERVGEQTHKIDLQTESHEEGEARFTPESKVSSLKSLAGSRDNEGVVPKKIDPGWPTLPGET